MSKANLQDIELDQLHRGTYQPRKHFDQEALDELAQSIRSNGLLQPIVVRPDGDNQFEIVAGERRWRACQLAGMNPIPCLVRTMSNEQAAEAAAIENLNRVDLNAIEEAKAYQRLIDEFGYIHDEIAIALGKSRTKITNALRLLKLEQSIQDLISQGRLSEGHGKTLAGLTAPQQIELANKSLARGWSVRKLETEAKKLTQLKQASSAKKDPNIKFLERQLTDHLGSKASIDFDEDHGQLKIDFRNLDVLEGILKQLGYVTK
jgi:ParB family chromosome partitioning protein